MIWLFLFLALLIREGLAQENPLITIAIESNMALSSSGWEAIVACSTISAVFRPAYIYSIKADNRGLLTLFQILRGHPY